MDTIRERFPGFKPRDDVDIFTVAFEHYDGPEKDIYDWIDWQIAFLRSGGSGSMASIRQGLSTRLNATGNITGVSE